METEYRPAFYALSAGAWRDYVTILHPPYTAWHLSYVVLGAAIAPVLHGDRLAATLLAFFLATGIGAHALDELHGRPLRTAIPDYVLRWGGLGSIAAACAIGVLGSIVVSPWLTVFIICGAFIAVAYNCELFGGRFHSDLWFALAWGAFPALTSYWINALTVSPEAVVVAVACAVLSLAQRALSSQVRMVRRRTAAVEGFIEMADGERRPLDRGALLAAPEAALRLLSIAVVLLALGLLQR